MKNFRKIALLFTILTIPCSRTFANNIYEFKDFLNDIKTVERVRNNINISKYEDQIVEIGKDPCIIQNYETYSYLTPSCLLNNKNYLDVKTSLKYLTQDLNTFYDTYQQDSYYFTYKATKPSFRYSDFDEYSKYRGTIYEKIAILYLKHENKMIKINNDILAKMTFENYSFYSVPTNLENRGPCSLTNYKLAISKLNGLELKPGEVLNLNKLISNDPRSCKGNSTKSFLFYGGSCGASSQLFRLALIMPDLTVLERAGHAKRRALYYGASIMGDDAAMYENSKKFIIRNDFDTSIYFITYEKGNYAYLVGIVPNKVDDYVKIIKNVNGYRSSVFKQVYNKYGTLIGNSQFDSVYSSIHRGKS